MRQDGKVLELLRKFEQMGIPSVDCVIYSKGKCVFRHQSGFSDESRTKPVDGSERYNLYSCSKPITCTAALQLIEKGRIRLDDPVADYLPEFGRMKKLENGTLSAVRTPITLRHLFTMTAGLTYDLNSENLKRGKEETGGRLPTREAMKYLALDPLAFEPGTQWRYSLCHDVLAAIVEVVSGERFGRYVKNNIFDPCGMTRSTFLLPENELGELAAQYRWNPETKEFIPCGPQNMYKLGSEYESGGAGCISTVDDYISFLENLRSGRLLGLDTLAQMMRPQLDENVLKSFSIPNYSYGLGVRCPNPDTGTRDFGWGGAAGSFLAVLPEEKATIFYAQQVLNSPNQQMRIGLVDALLRDLHS